MKKYIKNLSDNQKSEIILFLTSLFQLSELTTSFKLTVSKYFTLKTCSIKDVITEQNKPFTHIYIVKKGAFSLTYLNLKNTPIDFSIEHFIQFQEFSKESFSLNRQYELDGKLKYTLPEKLFTCLPGEFIGDIEWYTKAKNYLFQVTCIHEKSEVLMIDVNLFKEHIQYRIGRDFKDLIVKKMDTINARLNGIRHVEKQCKMNKLGSYENSMKKNLDNLVNYECRARALSDKVKPLQPFNLQQNKSCSHLLNKVRGYFESIDYNNEQHSLEQKIITSTNQVKLNKKIINNSCIKSFMSRVQSSKVNNKVENMMIIKILDDNCTGNVVKSFWTGDIKKRHLKLTKNQSAPELLVSAGNLVSQTSKHETISDSSSMYNDKLYYNNENTGKLCLNFNARFINNVPIKYKSHNQKFNRSIPLDKKIFLSKKRVCALLKGRYTFMRNHSTDMMIRKK